MKSGALVAVAAAAAVLVASVAAMDIDRVRFKGYQNKFSTSEENHVTVDVGGASADADRAKKTCSNFCAVHAWCGAFYVEGDCHLVHNDEVPSVYVEHGIGEKQ